MPLTDTACRTAKPSSKIRKMSDGGGLQLWIMPNGSKLWRLAYRFMRKPKSLSFGRYPIVTLAEARDSRDTAKKQLAKGTDPSTAKRRAKLDLPANQTTLASLCADFVEHQKLNKRAESTISKLEWLVGLPDGALLEMPVKDIRVADIRNALLKVVGRGRYETARRLLSTLGTVFRYGMASGRVDADPTPGLRGALPTPPRKNRAALTDPKAFGGLLRSIDGLEGQPQTIAALKLMALLFPRPGELRAAQWSEFDLEAGLWVIPSHRTKTRRPLKVPLSRQAIAILTSLHEITGNGQFVFPSVRTNRSPMSENTMNAALCRLGYGPDEMSPHGFRACASTLLNESRKWHADAIERQLGHVERSGVRQTGAPGSPTLSGCAGLGQGRRRIEWPFLAVLCLLLTQSGHS